MRLQTVTIFCPGCGSPRSATRRIRDKRCTGCKQDDTRKERRHRLADTLVQRLKDDGTPVIKTFVLRVIDVMEDYRRGVKAANRREGAR